MEKNKGRKIGIAVCIAVIAVGIISLVLYAGGFIPRIAELFNTEEQTQTQAPTQPSYVTAVEGPFGGMSAVVLEKGTDFSDITDAYDAVSRIAEWGFNTVILSGYDFSEAAQLATQSKSNGLFSVYMIDADDVVVSGVPKKEIAASLGGIGVDSVLISVVNGVTQNEVSLAAKTIREADDTLYIGVYAIAPKKYAPVCEADVFDYKLIDLKIPSSEVAGGYENMLTEYCDGTTKDTVFGMHTELLGNAKGYEKPDEIINQFAAVTSVASSGYSFYRYGVLAKNENLRNALIDYMKNGIMKDYFKELVISSPTKNKFETNQSKISFVGTGDITKPLTVNGKNIQMIDDGYFTYEQTLAAGENVFVFEHAGKKLTYTITYKMKLIESVSPQGDVSAPSGTMLDVVAVAHKSADVTATLGGISLKLVRSDDYDDSESADIGSDYTFFVGSFTLPDVGASNRSLGKIKVSASYKGINESESAATVTVTANQSFTPPAEVISTSASTTVTTTKIPATTVTTVPDVSSESSGATTAPTKPATTTQKPTTTQTPQVFELLTPYKNNGVSGKSKMIVVKNDYSETLPSATMNDVSVPYFVALPKGTIDYVVNTSSYDGIKYYVLSSGRRVYQKDVEYLASGYNMPSNEIRTVGVVKDTDETRITLTTRWKVPFNVREYPQAYYTQTSGRPYSVKNFTAEYVDIVFYHTTKVDAAPQLKTSVISKAQWLTNADGTCTLRLHLKKTGGFYGIKYYYNNDGTLTFSVKERANGSLSGKVIMLDPGHGGNDPGAIGAAIVGNKNVHEATINLSIANKVKSKLEALGATVIMTRSSSSKSMSLEERAALCRAKNPDVFVAIHCDASQTSSSVSGTTAYYYKSYSYPLAHYLSAGIVSAYKQNVYASNPTMAGKADRGTKFKGFKVTRIEECPSVLIEYGFVTNVVECKALANDSTQNALAQGTVDGLVNYFKNS